MAWCSMLPSFDEKLDCLLTELEVFVAATGDMGGDAFGGEPAPIQSMGWGCGPPHLQTTLGIVCFVVVTAFTLSTNQTIVVSAAK